MSEEWMKAAVWRVSVEDYGNRSGQATISGPGVYCMQVPVSYSMLDFMQALAAAPAQPAGQEQHPDDEAVDRFAVAMKAKLAKSREKGRHGWQTASAAHLSGLLYRHMYKADPLDVANLAMMLHQNGQAIELPQEARHGQGELYTCIGKGGNYELVGYARLAGELRGMIGGLVPDLAIYRSDTDYFARTRQDFKERMEPIDAASTGQEV